MQDVINTLMLVCASLASLALGVLLAYGFCRVTFVALRIHARSVAAQSSSQESQVKSAPQTASL